ncbi:MAG: DUF2652 domain-containing protein [Flavobacteriales bacterium]|nr:DUF2652 domain-containing protein [Flavobacteriales bacterium]
MNSDRALLFLPDISGFTRFVERTEIDHGQHIISELIELLIDEDKLGLTVAEVEGDAVFFYSPDAIPSAEALVDQCRRMFLRFHGHLRRYADERICDCGACSTAEKLTVKFVAHAGPIRSITVHGRTKPFGVDVILAHRLLKNDVAGSEYALLTEALVAEGSLDPPEGITSMPDGVATYEDLPPVPYHAVDLSGLHAQVKDHQRIKAELPRAATPMVMQRRITAPDKLVFRMLIDLDARSHWDALATRIDRPDTHVNRPGSRHTCVLPVGSMDLETISALDAQDGMEYVERALNVPFIPMAYVRYLVKPVGGATELVAELHLIPDSIIGKMMLPMTRSRMRKWISGSLDRLKVLLESADNIGTQTIPDTHEQKITTTT